MPRGKQEQAEQIIPKLREVEATVCLCQGALETPAHGATASTTRRYGTGLPSKRGIRVVRDRGTKQLNRPGARLVPTSRSRGTARPVFPLGRAL